MPENTGAAGGAGSRAWGVIVVNWNTPANTIECLESILAASNHPRRVVLVDNASSDESVARVAGWARQRGVGALIVRDGEESGVEMGDAWLLLIASRTARGFSANNNLGLRYFRDHARGTTHILLLNSDATVERDFFEELQRAVVACPDGGLFTGTIYKYSDRSVVWYAGGKINPLRALVTHHTTAPAAHTLRETPFICGCAMLIARPVLTAVGLLDESFDPAYCEDADYSLRVGAARFSLIYASSALVFHKIGGSIGPIARSPAITFAVNRNRALLIRRNYGGWRRAGGLAYLLITKPGRALIEAAKGRPRSGWAVFTGMVAGVVGRGAHEASACRVEPVREHGSDTTVPTGNLPTNS